jgi:choline dehydrogenase-like flavoprotein
MGEFSDTSRIQKQSDSPGINAKGKENNTYDAIVIGSGISGGWAAKELCEKGLKTLVLERGRMVEHIKDYITANTPPWGFPHRDQLTKKFIDENPQLCSAGVVSEANQHFFVKDKEHPYIEDKPFTWVRGYQVGGKSLLWARWTQRWSDLDYEANAKEGIAIDWPIRYNDIAPWYSYVERFVGISGNRDGLSQVPDGEYMPPMQMNCVEKHFKQSIETNYPGRNLIISRTANVTREINGRGPCQYRDLCNRGCPFGAAFSSNSATLPAAAKTGNLTIHPFAVVHSIIYDEKTNRASGVRVIDTNTKQSTEYFAKIIFVNASTINTALILLNSTSSRFPDGLGNDSGVLGHYLMDHNYRCRLSASYEGFQDQYYYGRRPTGVYIPRFRNFRNDKQKNFLRGYAYACGGSRGRAEVSGNNVAIGADFKNEVSEPGLWNFWMTGMGECLPSYENKVTLSKDKKDDWGMPILHISANWNQNEDEMSKDILVEGAQMFDKAGFKDISYFDSHAPMGYGIHEMGTARMGKDPKTSILNAFNQMHAVKNVFVSDGSCMTSGSCQNPSVTYMALTARATDHAVSELKKRNI